MRHAMWLAVIAPLLAVMPVATGDVQDAASFRSDGQIIGTLGVAEHEPIMLGCNCVIPEGASPVFFWRLPEACKYLEVGGTGETVHVWAPPGRYVVSVDVMLVDWESKRIEKRSYGGVLQVGPSPQPDPEPEPGPKPPPKPDTTFRQAVATAALQVPPDERHREIEVTQPDGNTSRKAVITAVGEVYRQIGREAQEKPSDWSPALMLSEAKQRNAFAIPAASLAAWQPFFRGLSAAFVAAGLSADDTAGHAQLFEDVADVLLST